MSNNSKKLTLIFIIYLSSSILSWENQLEELLGDNDAIEQAIKENLNQIVDYEGETGMPHHNETKGNDEGDMNGYVADLPWTLSEDYTRPTTKGYTSFKAYWEKSIFNLENNEEELSPSYVIFLDKPIYKPNEFALVSVYFYDKYSKKPISLKDANLESPTLSLFDSNDQEILKIDLKEPNNESIHWEDDKISGAVKVKIEEEYMGGSFYFLFSSENILFEEKVKFFISAYQNKKESIILDFNKDVLMTDDDLVGKVTLKLLGNDETLGESGTFDHDDLSFQYSIIDNWGKELGNGAKDLKEGSGYIIYKTPSMLENVDSLTIMVTLDYKGNKLSASKQISIVDITNLRVDFTPAGGKYSKNYVNQIYFQTYGNSLRTAPVEVQNAKILEICKSDFDGDNHPEPIIQDDDGSPNDTDDFPDVPDPNEEPVMFENPEFANQRVLENENTEIIQKKSFWQKFKEYFLNILDSFSGIKEAEEEFKDEIIQDIGVEPVENQHVMQGNGIKMSLENNFSMLPQSIYKTVDITKYSKVVTERINSNEEGKGNFKLFLKDNCSYYLQVTKENFSTKFFITNTDQKWYAIDQSDLRISLQKNVFEHNESLKVTVHKHKKILATHVRVVIQNKGRILLEKLIDFSTSCSTENEDEGEICEASFETEISAFSKSPTGGVFTVQVYREEMFYEPEQESLIFVYPKNKVKIIKKYSQTIYKPSQEVSLNLQIGEDPAKQYFYGVFVSDESAFLQVEKRNFPPSLISKILLEKEFRGNEGTLPNSHYLLNYLFENNSEFKNKEYSFEEELGQTEIDSAMKNSSNDKIQNLIGNQRWRQMFLSENQIKSYMNNVLSDYTNYDDERVFFDLDYYYGYSKNVLRDKKFKGKLEYLLPHSVKKISENSYMYEQPEMEMMFDFMPMAEAEFDEPMVGNAAPPLEDIRTKGEVMDDDAEEYNDAQDTSIQESATTSASNNSSDENDKSEESDKGEEDVNIELKDVNENTIFYSYLGWDPSSDLKFNLPDTISKFRVSVFAVSSDGEYGMHTDFIEVSKELVIDASYPQYVYSNETVNVQVSIYNNSFESNSLTNDFDSSTVVIDPSSIQRVAFNIPVSEHLPLKINFTDKNNKVESVTISPEIKTGLSFNSSTSVILKKETGKLSQNINSFKVMHPIIQNTFDFKLQYTPVGANVLLEGYERLIQEPYGCFEQTSSTTFPMVILLQYLSNLKNPENPDKIEEMKFDISKKLKNGIKKLMSFETSTGGFEWFGESPGHVTLTAYGLWQFQEMNELGNYVELDVIDRTLSWLHKQYNKNQVLFELSQGMDSFGNPPQTISDLYIIFVMTLFKQYDIDYDNLVKPIIDKFNNSNQSNDPYMISFVGYLYHNLKKNSEAQSLANKLVNFQNSETGSFPGAESTITISMGKSKDIETTAIASLFLMELDFDKYIKNIEKAIGFILENMEFGYFGSTQATVLGLKAIVLYTKILNKLPIGKKDFIIKVNDVEKNYSFEIAEGDDNDKEFEIVKFDELMSNTNQDINVEIIPQFELEDGEKYLFSTFYSYNSDNPSSASDSILSLNYDINNNQDIYNYNFNLVNKGSDELGMINLVFYKPSYLKVNLNDLETLKKNKVVDFYELRNNNSEIVFYWRGIQGAGSKQFSLSFLKEYDVTTEFDGIASFYVYYDKQGSIVFK